ncbi:cbb3-type cytochrome c oxidase subunit I [Ideonella livida]|uniref:Cbb3-type cytochrome c oxidase subunit I n=1 Tax=Ideonella livida TaxID=2707176 RepID=A0A7C9TLX8_9BURK|nr:cbb3-type cytochrome c oxidase subunit I [Ideonella livida]NDY92563.1 cbb3-type cytochrome c oxidase subunit I [Ideonella livida]
MSDTHWTLSPPSPAGARLVRAHLWLGVLALMGSGLLAVVLVLSRTPGVKDLMARLFPLTDLFRAALVVHVDLSVLIWFMTFASVAWGMVTPARALGLGWLGWALAAGGTLLMMVSPFLPGAQPLLNNYIPVLEQPAFLLALMMCGLGFAVAWLRTLLLAWPRADLSEGQRPLHLGIRLSAAAGALAWMTLAWTLWQLPAGSGTAYYERLFWAAGHVLQFQHALLVGVAWLWLAGGLGVRVLPGLRRLAVPAVVLSALPLAVVPVLLGLWPAGGGEQMGAFARLMQWGHLGMLPLGLLAVAALPGVWRQPGSAPRSAFLASLLLFAIGGLLAFLIRGANVVVPAHYHGSIVGVTLAFMGLAYALLPALGFRPVVARWARWQPLVYGGGQLLHVLGLAWSGGYGVQRKVAGTEQVLSSLPERLGMGMMGLGGLIAIVGGVMFVLACLQAMWPDGRAARPDTGGGEGRAQPT